MSDFKPHKATAAWHPTYAVSSDYSRQSNLALAFLSLSAEKRRDMDVFYTFCRLVDDIADSESLPPEHKSALLQAWRNALRGQEIERSAQAPLLIEQIHELIARYQLPLSNCAPTATGSPASLDW